MFSLTDMWALLGVTLWCRGPTSLPDGILLIDCEECPCPKLPCGQCSGETPAELLLDLSGVVPKNETECPNCGDWNTVWVVPWEEIDFSCDWFLEIEPVCGDPDDPPHYIRVHLNATGDYSYIQVEFADDDAQSAIFEAQWDRDDFTIDCADIEQGLIDKDPPQDGTIPLIGETTIDCSFEDAILIITS